MNQEKILLQIETELSDLRSFVKKLKPDARVHQIDIDLIRQKVRSLYETTLLLESFPEATLKATVADMKKPLQVSETKEEYDDSFQKEKNWNESKDNVLKAEDLVAEPQDEPEEQEEKDTRVEVLKEKVEVPQEPQEKVNKDEVPDEPVKEETEPAEETEKEVAGTEWEEEPAPPDLFSAAPDTVADKLSGKASPTLAEKLSQKKLESLKKNIGINEKFLFINELFNGDMGSYNSAINELDSLKTLEGANTYLFELKIQNQWPDDLEAYKKLKELIENKYAE